MAISETTHVSQGVLMQEGLMLEQEMPFAGGFLYDITTWTSSKQIYTPDLFKQKLLHIRFKYYLYRRGLKLKHTSRRYLEFSGSDFSQRLVYSLPL
jgi:hypothetical protein